MCFQLAPRLMTLVDLEVFIQIFLKLA